MKPLVTLLLLSVFGRSFAQSDARSIQNLLQNDSSSLRLIFSYPDSIRQVVFVSFTYPQGFTRLSDIQKITAASFQKLASTYNHNRQKQLWEITRYPELPALLIANKDKKKEDLDALLKGYSDDTHKAAHYFVKRSETLVEMEKISSDFKSRSSLLINNFPLEARSSFALLLQDPELFSLLSEDIRTAVVIGDLYKRNPRLLNFIADSVYIQLARESGQEYEDWKKGIRNDSLIQIELKEVSKKYASDEDNADDVYGNNKKRNLTLVFNPPSYPFWAGYPHWYAYPSWRPYPWWYHAGFYIDHGGSIIFIGMPSYQFGWWYYGHPKYYKHYHTTSRYFDMHYRGHPRSNGGFNRSVRDHSQGAPRNAPRGAPNKGGGGRTR